MPPLEYGAGGSWRKKQPGLEIRQVWADNVEHEFKLIRSAVEVFPYVSMDTEFPGVIYRPSKHPAALTAAERYALVKANVDALHLIQVGLTFAASPTSPPALAFEINLREFDHRVHRHAPDSIRLLAANGLDLAAHRARGVSARTFAALLMSSGLVCNSACVTWVTFHSAYDFAYLVKLLIGSSRKLPRTLPEFLNLVRVYFGEVYDVKHMMSYCGDLFGGLERVAATLKVERAAGRGHQAGSDSVLTWDTFRRIKQLYFAKEGVEYCAGVLFGLEDTKTNKVADNKLR
uniref:poly(A)-specific ribonuclease n=1 Tax=Arundo donax TaxID=35708 RepID=A0A0A9GL11_ARUDO